MKKIGLPRRLLMFFWFGVIAEAVRLLAFRFFQDRSALLANFISVPFGVLVAFALYTTFVWPDRPAGSRGRKFVRFSINKGITTLVKWGFFPAWFRTFPCPLYELTYSILDFFTSTVPLFSFLNELVTCEWMSVASMDLTIALTLSFYLHNNVSFAEEKTPNTSGRRKELRQLLNGFGMVSLIILSFLGIYCFGAWGLTAGSISGYLLGILIGATYVAIARPGLAS